MKPTRYIAIILMAGSSERIPGLDKPKQFYEINRKPLYLYTLQVFEDHPKIDEILVVTNREYVARVRGEVDKARLKKVKDVISGGRSRTESAYMAVEYINGKYDDREKYVIIHDGVRPFVTPEIIDKHIEKAAQKAVVCTVLPVYDSIIDQGKKKNKVNYLNREELLRMQTPQSFYIDEHVMFAYSAAFLKKTPVTDDYGILKGLGYRVKYVEGTPINFKITTMDDLNLAEQLLTHSPLKTSKSTTNQQEEKKEEPIYEPPRYEQEREQYQSPMDYKPVFGTAKEDEEEYAPEPEEVQPEPKPVPTPTPDPNVKPKLTRVIKPLGEIGKPTASDYNIDSEAEYDLHPKEEKEVTSTEKIKKDK